MADTIRVVIEGVDAASHVLSGIAKESDKLNKALKDVGLGLAAMGTAITGVLGLSVKAAGGCPLWRLSQGTGVFAASRANFRGLTRKRGMWYLLSGVFHHSVNKRSW